MSLSPAHVGSREGPRQDGGTAEAMTDQGTAPAETAHPALADPVLRRFAREARAFYGPRLERIILFGSRARGDHGPHSDYDVAVFLHGFTRLWPELEPLARITTGILLDTGADVSAKPFPADQYRTWSPFMDEIQRDGVDL
ncbi:nucleotidyltransferase domain-containing protein [Roseomonas sp. CCTCC AB2023176]|uniref:nucleotidyltransferase domain-containing protein n=1 Tax=Roseomonas sp. CCTCC AB2023176 TaxID=3342640 RepID=UPI0035D5F076